MELQDNLKHFEQRGIKPYAISYDPVETLKAFAEKHGIAYPLLSDANSAVIRTFGLFNTTIPEGHRAHGVPFPGTYMVDPHGVIVNKSFYDTHNVRDAIAKMLQESFHIDVEGRPRHTLENDDLKATAALTSGTIRRGQVQTFTLDIALKNGRHIYGPNVRGGYTPTTLTFDAVEDVQFGAIDYPQPETRRIEILNETVPVFTVRLTVKATVTNLKRENFTVRARLHYQACDDRECYLPNEIAFELPLTYLDNI